MKRNLFTSFFLLLLALSACQTAPTVAPLPTTEPPTLAPTGTTAPPPPQSPAGPPADWTEWRHPALDATLRFPAGWQMQSDFTARGADGFWQVETRPYPPSLYDQLSFLCVQEANDPAQNARYGKAPFIYDWQGWDSERNLWLGQGCIVAPNAPQPGLESVLFARHPSEADTLLILRADAPHFEQILATLRFPRTQARPEPSGNYNSPACREVPPVPPVSTRQTAGFLITEYAIAVEACHPIQHFDGFHARFDSLGLNLNTLWSESQRQTAQAANQKLALFGLRLVERQTPHPWLSFDLQKGDEILVSGLVRLGEVSLRADGIDFIFWATAEDERGSQFPILVYKNGLDTFSVWEQGFHSVWAGSQLISYRYSQTKLFPVGAPADIEIFADGQPIRNIAIPHMGPAGSPVRGLWRWEEHWVMEIRSILFVDGLPVNQSWGYDEIFDWHLVNNKPFFAARRGGEFVLVYNGEELPVVYDDMAHGDVCCETGIYDFQPLADGAFFYARRDGVWFGVRAQAVGE